MSTAADSSKNENESTYVINAEDAAEMARLLDQNVNVHGFLRYPPLFPNLCSR